MAKRRRSPLWAARTATTVALLVATVALVSAIGRPEAGPVEKLVLGAVALCIAAVARAVWRVDVTALE